MQHSEMHELLDGVYALVHVWHVELLEHQRERRVVAAHASNGRFQTQEAALLNGGGDLRSKAAGYGGLHMWERDRSHAIIDMSCLDGLVSNTQHKPYLVADQQSPSLGHRRGYCLEVPRQQSAQVDQLAGHTLGSYHVASLQQDHTQTHAARPASHTPTELVIDAMSPSHIIARSLNAIAL